MFLLKKIYRAIRPYRDEPIYAVIMMIHSYNAGSITRLDTEVVL